MSDISTVDPNLAAAQTALGPDASADDLLAYAAALDNQATTALAAGTPVANPGWSPLGGAGSPGDTGGPALPGQPDAATAAAISALGTNPGGLPQGLGSSGGGSGGSGSGSGTGTGTSTDPASAAAAAAAAATAAAQKEQAQSASQMITTFFAGIPGLAALDPTGILASWASSQANSLAGLGLDSGSIVSEIEATMNNPENNPAALGIFNALFPGYNQKIQNGTTNADGSYQGIQGYLQYSSQLSQFAQQAGLVPGTINQEMIGNLWAGNISSSEVSQRVTDAVVATTSAPQPVQDYLAANYGMGPGALASYYLNPTNTLQQITQNLNAGMVGGAAAQSGFDTSLSTAHAQALGAFLANGTSSGNGAQVGTPNTVGYEQATNAFTSSLGSNQAGGQLGSAAQMAAAGYTTANLPGQTGGVVSEDTLLAAIQGNATALQQTSAAEQTRRAGSGGGGGVAASTKGIGIGFAND